MKSALMLLPLATIASTGFMPNVRIDHQNLPTHQCFRAAITVGPGPSGQQPLYVAIEDDSIPNYVPIRSDVLFQRSTDAGTTWLSQDLLIKRGEAFAGSPDVITDRAGNVYIAYTEKPSGSAGHAYCMRSTNGGATWSPPAQIDDNDSIVTLGWVRIAADTAGNLLAAWNQKLGDNLMHILSSVSSDQGATWAPRVQVDNDTFPGDRCHVDVAVQPGTNDYLVVARVPFWYGTPFAVPHALLYRSTDMGSSFQSGVQLDTFTLNCGQPHVVADAGHIICDYCGYSRPTVSQYITESRTLYTDPDTWGSPSLVADLDTLYSSYVNGAKLAISADGKVHVVLMICDLIYWNYNTYYASSSDHGATWSGREIVNDDTAGLQVDPDIGADADGFAYCVWQDGRHNRGEIWFATNRPAGIAEGPHGPRGSQPLPTVVRRLPPDAAAFDATGRRVLNARPGVYFVKEPQAQAHIPRKVLLVK